jgi:hypothetical protein
MEEGQIVQSYAREVLRILYSCTKYLLAVTLIFALGASLLTLYGINSKKAAEGNPLLNHLISINGLFVIMLFGLMNPAISLATYLATRVLGSDELGRIIHVQAVLVVFAMITFDFFNDVLIVLKAL